MNIPKTLTGIAALTLAFALSAPLARADERNELSYLTFDQSVQIPAPSGQPIVLPPGTYEFRVLTGMGDSRDVQVFSESPRRLMTTVHTNSTEFVATTNRDLTDHTILTFAQGAPGEPLTLIKWYYADRNIGHEFAYSGQMERQLSEEEPITVVAQSANSVAANQVQTASNLH